MGDVESNLTVDEEQKLVLLSINPKIYPLDVIMSASYLFTDRYYVFLDGDIEEEIMVEIRPKNDSENLRRIGREFNNELINFANYAIQEIKNQSVRDAIMNRVLETNIPSQAPVDQECDCYQGSPASYSQEGPWEFDDPEGIAVPWEEKHRAKEAPVIQENPASDVDIDESDDFEDPEGIAIPWEEKYGKDAVKN